MTSPFYTGAEGTGQEPEVGLVGDGDLAVEVGGVGDVNAFGGEDAPVGHAVLHCRLVDGGGLGCATLPSADHHGITHDTTAGTV